MWRVYNPAVSGWFKKRGGDYSSSSDGEKGIRAEGSVAQNMHAPRLKQRRAPQNAAVDVS